MSNLKFKNHPIELSKYKASDILAMDIHQIHMLTSEFNTELALNFIRENTKISAAQLYIDNILTNRT